jgi:unsaturated chondroitin disaccharide hydrolase
VFPGISAHGSWPRAAARRTSAAVTTLMLAGAALIVPMSADASELDALTDHALQFAASRLSATVVEAGTTDRFPRSTLSSGAWGFQARTDWTSGFFPGCLWLLYEATGEAIWRQRAESWSAGVEPQKYNTGSHDVGFQIFCSFGNGVRLTGNPAYRAVINQGATSLSTRFNAVVGCTRSWNNWTFPVIVDNMMNLEILYWSARNGGDPAFGTMAVSHGSRSRQDHVRADGSTFHLVDYNPATGAILHRGTVQGASDASTWARGQAWGLYGFTMSYRESAIASFRTTAQNLADYFIDHLPADHVPYWDFQAPGIPNQPRDTSAAAIAASGLLELSTLAADAAARNRYRSAAIDILTALCSPAYLAEGSTSHGILLHGVGNKPAASEVDVSLIYGDYYFLEALLRYRSLATDVLTPARVATLDPVYPNPFNPGVRIGFEIMAPGPVTVRVLDARGTEVRRLIDRTLPAGRQAVSWDGSRRDGSRAASGVYFVSLETRGYSQVRKAALVR